MFGPRCSTVSWMMDGGGGVCGLCVDYAIFEVDGEFILVKLCIDGITQPRKRGRVTVSCEDIVVE